MEATHSNAEVLLDIGDLNNQRKATGHLNNKQQGSFPSPVAPLFLYTFLSLQYFLLSPIFFSFISFLSLPSSLHPFTFFYCMHLLIFITLSISPSPSYSFHSSLSILFLSVTLSSSLCILPHHTSLHLTLSLSPSSSYSLHSSLSFLFSFSQSSSPRHPRLPCAMPRGSDIIQ